MYPISNQTRVLRVEYKKVVEETAHQVRSLFAHFGLKFEKACLDLHQTRRPVRTASAEQVRQPINRIGLGVASGFDANLGLLKSALGEALTNPTASL